MNKLPKIQRDVMAPHGSSVVRIRVLAGIALLFAEMICPGFGKAETHRDAVKSPDGRLVLRVETQPMLSLSIERDGQIAIPPSPAGIVLEHSGAFPGNLRCIGVKRAVINESFALPVGKRSRLQNRANELTLDFGNEMGQVKFSLVLRAYDEGVAYRYRIHGSGEDTVVSETSGFRIPTASTAWFAKYVSYYESIYKIQPAWTAYVDDIQVPALFKTPGSQWVYLTEADVDGSYSGARLHVIDPATGLVGYKLEGHPHSKLPWETPWRVSLVTADLRALVESSLVVVLGKPSAIADTSWIKPGTDIFPWVTGPLTNNSSLERMKQFVDLAADLGWGWIEFDNALALEDPGTTYKPPERWMDCPWFPQLTAYAAAKHVAVYGWDHWHNFDTPEKRSKYLDWYAAKGFKGIKVDFLESDSQERYRFREEMAHDCAERKLLVSFHGDVTPRSMERRWPNIATYEGVLGEEYYQGFAKGLSATPTYNVNLVFTRNVAGSMDYTPTDLGRKGRLTTSAHEMALAVVFESGWQSIGIDPESAKAYPNALAFLKNLPSVWDDIRFIDGRPDEFAVVARRKGKDWWVAGINSGTSRTLHLKLDFLKPGTYSSTLYQDDPATENASSVTETKIAAIPVTIDAKTPLAITLAPNGGFGLTIEDSALPR
jgi:hypothetical protein